MQRGGARLGVHGVKCSGWGVEWCVWSGAGYWLEKNGVHAWRDLHVAEVYRNGLRTSSPTGSGSQNGSVLAGTGPARGRVPSFGAPVPEGSSV